MIEIAADTDRLNTHRALALSIYNAGPVHDAALRAAIESAETVEEIAGFVTGRHVKAPRRRRSKDIEGQLSFDFNAEGVVDNPSSAGALTTVDPSIMVVELQASAVASEVVESADECTLPSAGKERETEGVVERRSEIPDQADSGAFPSICSERRHRNILVRDNPATLDRINTTSALGRPNHSGGPGESYGQASPLQTVISAHLDVGQASLSRMPLGP